MVVPLSSTTRRDLPPINAFNPKTTSGHVVIVASAMLLVHFAASFRQLVPVEANAISFNFNCFFVRIFARTKHRGLIEGEMTASPCTSSTPFSHGEHVAGHNPQLEAIFQT